MAPEPPQAMDPTHLGVLDASSFEVDADDPAGTVTTWKLHFCNYFYRALLTRGNQRLAYEIMLQVDDCWL